MELTYIFDFGSTLVEVESLDELARLGMEGTADAADRLAELQAITMQGMEGKLPFDESLRRRIDLLHATKQHVNTLAEQLKDAITDSALEYADWFEENADNIYVVSGGFEDYIIPVVAELGIQPSHVFANRFEYDEVGTIIGFDSRSLLSGVNGKAAQVAELQLAGPVIMIGDGATDYEVRARGHADEFWAFTQHITRPSVVERADRVLASFEEISSNIA